MTSTRVPGRPPVTAARLPTYVGAAAVLLAATCLVPPAYGDQAEWYASPCGWMGTHDATGLVTDDPDQMISVISVDGAVAVDLLDGDDLAPATHPGPARITQHCSLQVDDWRNAVDGFTARATAYCEFSSAEAGPATRTAVLPPGACVRGSYLTPDQTPFFCTWWRIEHAGGTEDWLWDDDMRPQGSGRIVPGGTPANCAPPW